LLVIYTFVFSVVFKARWGGDEPASKSQFAILLFIGIIVHTFISETLSRAPALILTNVSYVKKILFPLEILPIVAIGTGSVPPRKPKGGIVTAKTASSPPWRPAPLGITFEHSFPSARELQESPALLKRASRHVIEVLSKRPPMVARLRDVQLLLHLSSILDGATMGAMCESLAAPASAVLPQGVLMAMEMATLSLQGGAEGETEEDEL